MITDETITNLQRALAVLSAKDPQLAQHLELRADTDAAEAAPAVALNEATAAAIAGVPTDGEVKLLATAAWLPPVVGSPVWFLEEVAVAYGQGRTDYLVDELCGLQVVQREELSEPVLILQDGSWYTIVPEWARAAAQQAQADDTRRQIIKPLSGGVPS